jgi:hypothetical protein
VARKKGLVLLPPSYPPPIFRVSLAERKRKSVVRRCLCFWERLEKKITLFLLLSRGITAIMKKGLKAYVFPWGIWQSCTVFFVYLEGVLLLRLQGGVGSRIAET